VRYLDSRGALSEIIKLLKESSEFNVAVAYSTGQLPKKLIKALEGFLRRGGDFNFLVGIARNTSGKPLQQLYDLPRSGVNLRCTKRWNFHPKLYTFRRKGGKIRGIIGSSNFSAAGFSTNIEANLLVDDVTVVGRMHREFLKHFDDSKVGPIDQGIIDKLNDLKDKNDEERKRAMRRIKLAGFGAPRTYFINMRGDEVSAYLKSGKYYSSLEDFTKCVPENVRKGDVVILRTIRPSPGVVGISTVTGIERVRKNQERDVRKKRGYVWGGAYVVHYEPIKMPIPLSDAPFNWRGWRFKNRFGQYARALQGTVVGSDPEIVRKYLKWYRKQARRAVKVRPEVFSAITSRA